ncbi:MAG: phage tail protein [Proteobacteria bacterium]|nr:phage tail protein [Pseudomonadota bacterium]
MNTTTRRLLKSTVALALAAGFTSTAQACPVEAYAGTVCYVAGNYCPDDGNKYMKADGTVLNANQYQMLFAIIGGYYGGDGRTTFALPDLRGRAAIGAGQGAGLTNVPLGTKRGAEGVVLAAIQVPLVPHTHGANFTATTGPQQVTIPAQAGSGAITATATTDIVPGSNSVDPAANISDYYLTGVTSGAAGPVTRSTPGTDKSTLIGTKVAVSTSGYKSPTDAQTVSVTTVTGGTVAIAAAGQAASAPVSLISPQQALTACIATGGYFPPRP